MRLQDSTRSLDDEIALQLERVIRRVKVAMSYRGSYSTRDILGALVARWVQSGEWSRLKALPPDQRRMSESVRRFILDRFDQLRRRGRHELLDPELDLPTDAELSELVETAELRTWIAARVDELETGVVDGRVRIHVPDPVALGSVLRLHLSGLSQREIARSLEMSLGVVNRRIAIATSYLAVLHGIECGVAC
jgi:hypothetical protein